MVRALAGTALLHAAWKRGVVDESQRDHLRSVLDQEDMSTLDAVRSWLDDGRWIEARMGRTLGQCLAKPGMDGFGAYQPLAHLDEGGMGSLWLAASPERELVVIKTLRRNLSGIQEYARRFERETAFMRSLDHPGLVRCLDSSIGADGTPFLVMEFVPAGTLKQLAVSAGLDPVLALTIVWRLLGALDYVHGKSLIHRDVKPSNVFADRRGFAKLGDFGLARSTGNEFTALTMMGSLIGTPHYMSPEQVAAEGECDIRSDLYALGATLCYAVIGRDPYTGKHHEVMHAHRTAPVPDVAAIRPEVGDVAAIVSRAMQKDPADRYQEPRAMRVAVAEALAGLGVEVDDLDEDQVVSEGTAVAASPPASAAAPAVVSVPAPADPPTDPATPADAVTPADRSTGADASAPVEATVPMDLLAESAPSVSTPTAPRGEETGRHGSTALNRQQPTPTAGDVSDLGRDGARHTPVAARRAGHSVAGESLDGDLAAGLACDWLCLHQVDGAGRIMLWARTAISMGKMRQYPVDLCLRNYPIAEHKQACQRVSRQHASLALEGDQLVLMDLGSANGTVYDGGELPPRRSMVVVPGPDHLVVAAGTVALRVRALRRSGAVTERFASGQVSGRGRACGLDVDLPLDAVVITRPENRPEWSYAMVLRRLVIGGHGADLVPIASSGPERVELALFDGRWLQRRRGGGGVWQPLGDGAHLRLGGHDYRVEAGEYRDFQ